MTDTAVAVPACPYKGLAAFADSDLDALFFFGREREIEIIAANLIASRLTVLYGPSGVGKTSLLRAGVARRLREEGAAVAVISSWSGDPVAGLLSAVDREVRRVAPDADSPPAGSVAEILEGWARRLGADLYLILDQFEEYFLYHGEEAGPGPLVALADAIREPGTRVHVVVSVREDALAQLDAFKSQLPGLFGNSLRLDRLDRRAATRAIRGPLGRYNELVAADDAVEIEDPLVDEVLGSVEAGRIRLGDTGRGGSEEGSVEGGRVEAPYLQLVLERLWEVETERGSKHLRRQTLRDLGGASRIVEDHLERAMAALSPSEKDAAAAMYNHLVTPSGTKIAHRAGDLARYAAVDEREAQQVLQRLTSERIVRAGENGGTTGRQYEIFHDVLADAVLAWRTRHETERRLRDERAEAARRHRTLLGVAVGALAAVVILAGVTVYALTQRSDARESAQEARELAREARTGELVARAAASLATDPDQSLRLALEASKTAQTPTVEDALRRTLRALRVSAVISGPSGRRGIADIAFTPDRSRLAVAPLDGFVRLFDASGNREVRRFRASSRTVSFSSDGRRLVTAGRDGVARIWDVRTGKQLLGLRHGGSLRGAFFFARDPELVVTTNGEVAKIWTASTGGLLHELRQPGFVGRGSFNRDGDLVVATAGDRSVSDKTAARIFNVTTGSSVATLRHAGRITVARFDPTGRIVATGGADDLARLWDARSGRLLAELEGHVRGVLDVAFSRDGRLVATASQDGTARVWSMSDGELGKLVAILPGHPNWVTRLEFSPDSSLVITGSRDQVSRVFDARSGTLRAVLDGHAGAITDVAFGANGRTAATASSDGTVRVWDTQPFQELELVRQASSKPLGDVAFNRAGGIVASEGGRLSPDGRQVATRVDKDTIRVADLRSSEVIRTLRSPGVLAWAFSPDGETLVTHGRDGVVRLLRLSDGKLERTAELPLHASTAIAISPDGRFVATTGEDQEARLHDAQTGRQVWGLSHASGLRDVAFSGDGRWVAIAGPRHLGIVDARTGERILQVDGKDIMLTATAFSPKGWRIATGSDSGKVKSYDCRLCGGIDELVKLAEERLAQLRPKTP